jgi:hypothetical protein
MVGQTSYICLFNNMIINIRVTAIMKDILQNNKDLRSRKKVYMYSGVVFCIFWRTNTGAPTETIAILPNSPDT